MNDITPITPVLRDMIIAAWRTPGAVADMPDELRAQIPANPAGNVAANVQNLGDGQGDHYTVSCYSSECYSSGCFTNVCYSADCFTGQNHCGYTTSC